MSADNTQNYGTGRRKTSVARVFIRPGQGQLSVNGRSLDHYFGCETSRMVVCQPLVLLGVSDMFDLTITVKGGGTSGQAGAIRHGITRALIQYDEASLSADDEPSPDSWRRKLRTAGFVTRDGRMVERNKVGFRKARKRKQYSKR